MAFSSVFPVLPVSSRSSSKTRVTPANLRSNTIGSASFLPSLGLPDGEVYLVTEAEDNSSDDGRDPDTMMSESTRLMTSSLEKQHLQSLWLLCFEDDDQEATYIKDVIVSSIQKNILKWCAVALSLLFLIHGPGYASGLYFPNSKAVAATYFLIGTHVFQMVLVGFLVCAHYGRTCMLQLDTTVFLVFLLALVSLYACNLWRLGKWFADDPLLFIQSHTADFSKLNINDISLLMGSNLGQTILTTSMRIRSSRCLGIAVASPLTYLFMSIHHDWSPHSRSEVAIYSTLLVGTAFALWTAHRSGELRDRMEWSRLKSLQQAVVALALPNEEETDSPDNPSTPSGSWTLQWVGPHVHKGLARRNSLELARRNSLERSAASRDSLARSSDSAWVVNASPFDVTLGPVNDLVQLGANSFRETRVSPQDSALNLGVVNPCGEISAWKKLPCNLTLQVRPGNWCKGHYNNEVARLQLPDSDRGTRLGALKLVRGPGNLLLIAWSPPAENRGMPLDQYEKFLLDVIAYPGQWKCKLNVADGSPRLSKKGPGDRSRNMYDACDHMIIPTVACLDASYAEVCTDFGPPDLFGSHVWGEEAGETLKAIRSFLLATHQEEAEPPPASTMSSVSAVSHYSLPNDNIVFNSLPSIECVGPAMRTGSKLSVALTSSNQLSEESWSEQSRRQWGPNPLSNWSMPRSGSASLMDSKYSSAAVDAKVGPECRIWFCTCCNNQSRVQEELGTDVSSSPFARVIRSPICTKIAVISPLLALSRKWCNFEFCLGHNAGKEVALVTSSGIVQAGQVAPRMLHEMALRLSDFSCAHATCSSKEDEVLIDTAIAEMGGYEALDANLKKTFRRAIHAAHELTSQALDEIDNLGQ